MKSTFEIWQEVWDVLHKTFTGAVRTADGITYVRCGDENLYRDTENWFLIHTRIRKSYILDIVHSVAGAREILEAVEVALL